MRHRWFWTPSAVLAMVFCLGLAAEQANAGNREIGGYVAQAEKRFQRNVWNFIKNFKSWKSIGGHQWKYDQYYWMEPWVFDGSHGAYVDSQDFAYVACHGTEWKLCCHDGIVDVDLRNVPAYGDLPNGGDMEFLVVESCDTITAYPESTFDWNDWRNTGGDGIFGGLHQAMGFWTLSISDNKIPQFFAGQVKGNNVVWQSWFTAVQLERQFPTWLPTSPESGVAYPGWASAIMPQKCKYDRLGSYSSDPVASDLLYSVWED
ncbi:MAG: hypothetical protein GF393_05645 [Armatimonadia bacterium]|nr:hypothetical protein [Armatimonadia bacterium]